MTRILVLIAALVLAAGPAFAESGAPAKTAKPVALRTQVTVRGRMVRLGDLFRNVGARAAVAIAYAPAPGRSAVLDAQWLAETARRHNVRWRPLSDLDRVVVRRASRQLKRAEIAKRLIALLRRRGAEGELRLALGSGIDAIHLPADTGPGFEIRDLRYAARTGRVSAVLTAPAGDPTVTRRISGRLLQLVAVPVPMRRVRRGEIIRARDLELRKLARSELPRGVVTDRDALVGLAARHALRSGLPVRARDVKPPTLVKRGAIVTMEIRTAFMRLTARGKALDNGARGDTVRVRNTHSKRVVEGVVTGPGRVAITGAGRTARR